MQNIQQAINSISSKNTLLRKACEEITSYDSFFEWPASTGIHHGYVGGLVKHTLEVLEYALHNAKLFPNVNKDVLIAACLWHDFAKLWDYKAATYFKDEYDELPKYFVLKEDFVDYKQVFIADPDYKSQIHHITGSVAEFTAAALKHNVSRATIQDVQHCIISHHGRKEWGSIKEPQTLEAMILHHADNMSAKFGAAK